MTVYLSKLVLNPTCPEVYRDISNVVQMHKTICSAFDDLGKEASPRSGYNLLYRLETDANAGSISLLVQCEMEKQPAWDRINEALHTRYIASHQTTSLSWLFPLLVNGATCKFRLYANAVKRPRPEKHLTEEEKKAFKPGKTNRIPLVKEEQRIKWLIKQGKGTRQFPGHGFDLVKVNVVMKTGEKQDGCGFFELAVSAQQDKHGNEDATWMTPWDGRVGKNLVKIKGVTFDGLLKITDQDRFANAVKHGIGPAKAYGCGLLSVLPLK